MNDDRTPDRSADAGHAGPVARGGHAAPPGLDAWLAAARGDLATRQPPEWLAAQVIARAQTMADERAALGAVDAARAAGRTADAAATVPRSVAAGAGAVRPAAVRTARTWRFWTGWVGLPAGALAASVLLLVMLRPAVPVAVPASQPAPFLALASLEQIEAEPGRVVVPVQVVRASLAQYGFPVDPARADEPARAELLLSTRGMVLALRVIE